MMLVNHIVEPLLVFGAFIAVAALSTWIIVIVAKKYGTDEKNAELLDSVKNIHDQAENILKKTGSYMQQTEDLADDMRRKHIEKKRQKREKWFH